MQARTPVSPLHKGAKTGRTPGSLVYSNLTNLRYFQYTTPGGIYSRATTQKGMSCVSNP